MRAALKAIGLGFAVLLLVAAPAAAQYGPPSSVPPENPPPKPPPGHQIAEQTPGRGGPGTRTTFASRPDVCIPGTTATLFMARARQNAPARPVGTATVNSDGSITHTFEIPDVGQGVYIVYSECEHESGATIRAVSMIMVLPAAASATGVPAAQPATVEVPAEVARLQQPAAVEAVLAEEQPAPAVVVEDGRLAVAGASAARARLGTTGSNTTGLVTGALVLLLVGTGLVMLRRRPRSRATNA